MKVQLVRSLMLFGFVLVASIISVSAQVQWQIRAQIPFDFYMESRLLPAGEYVISSEHKATNRTALTFRDKEGKTIGTWSLQPMASAATKTQDYPFVTFVRYGTFYFFSEFHHQAEGFDAKLPRLTVDKRISMKYGRPDNVVLVATSD